MLQIGLAQFEGQRTQSRMKDDNTTLETTPTPNNRRLSHGLKSLVALCLLGSASAVVGLVSVNPSQSPVTIEQGEFVPPSPALAATLVSATDVEPLQFDVERVSGRLKSRETLTDLVTRLGADTAEAARALHTLYDGELLNPRKLRPGLQVEAFLQNGNLRALSIRADSERTLFVTPSFHGDWTATELKARLQRTVSRIEAPIETSIYEAALKLGARDQQVVDFASIFAYDVDFQREIYPGDTFEIVYETFADERGNPVRNGDVLYARLNGRALTRGFYKFTPDDDGVTDYFDSNGESATKFLMKTPINGARLSSSFGMRRHPISGYSRLHKGTDFAAPTGTPVYAAGHGKIERASRYGGYGHYVRIRHANGYKTAYAHLSRYGRGIRAGKRVRQGDIIGYVGSTGASTGPHLHYEIYIDGKPVNAMKLKLPTGRKLAESPEILDEFLARKAAIDSIRIANGASVDTAQLLMTPPSP